MSFGGALNRWLRSACRCQAQCVRKPSAGRPAKPARQVFEGIVHVLRTGFQWKALPAERFGSAGAIHKRFLEWGGLLQNLWVFNGQCER